MVSLNLGGLLTSPTPPSPPPDGRRRRAAAGGGSSERELVAGRVAAQRCVYDLTKFGVGGFSESARQEFARRHLRVAVLEPGWCAPS